MRRRILTVVGVIGLLCTVTASARKPETPAPGPERGAIGMTIKVKAQLVIGGWLYATQVYLARVGEGGDPLRADEVIDSRGSRRSTCSTPSRAGTSSSAPRRPSSVPPGLRAVRPRSSSCSTRG